jgi:hypothetical protein
MNSFVSVKVCWICTTTYCHIIKAHCIFRYIFTVTLESSSTTPAVINHGCKGDVVANFEGSEI